MQRLPLPLLRCADNDNGVGSLVGVLVDDRADIGGHGLHDFHEPFQSSRRGRPSVLLQRAEVREALEDEERNVVLREGAHSASGFCAFAIAISNVQQTVGQVLK